MAQSGAIQLPDLALMKELEAAQMSLTSLAEKRAMLIRVDCCTS